MYITHMCCCTPLHAVTCVYGHNCNPYYDGWTTVDLFVDLFAALPCMVSLMCVVTKASRDMMVGRFVKSLVYFAAMGMVPTAAPQLVPHGESALLSSSQSSCMCCTTESMCSKSSRC